MPEVTIYAMTGADLPRVLELARQLGYPDEMEALSARFDAILQRPDHELVAARAEGAGVVGWLHLCLLTPLEAPFALQISGIVVEESWRGRGVGRQLLRHAERRARQLGLDRLTLRSRDNRSAAHGFYRSRGFVTVKTSVVFEKILTSDQS